MEFNMEPENINKLYELIKSIKVTEKNKNIIEEIKEDIKNNDYKSAIQKIKQMNSSKDDEEELEQQEDENESRFVQKKQEEAMYPEKISNPELEQVYIGLLLSNPKQIVKYYFIFELLFRIYI